MVSLRENIGGGNFTLVVGSLLEHCMAETQI